MKLKPWLVIPAAIAVAATTSFAAGVRVNWTPSQPVGLWRIHPVVTPTRGMLAEVCMPRDAGLFAMERGYIGTGNCENRTMPVLKNVAAVPGDTVEVTADGVLVNGTRVVPPALPADSQGRPMQAVEAGTYHVQPGEVWLLSAYNPKSFDSRYYGAVPIEYVRAIATPILVW